MAIFLIIALIPICTVLVWCCSSNKSDDIMMQMHRPNSDGSGGDEMQPNPIISFEDTNIDSTFYCRRVLQFFMQFFSLFLMWVYGKCDLTSHIFNRPKTLFSFLFASFPHTQSLNHYHVYYEWTDSIIHFEYAEYRAIIAVGHRNV